MKVAVLADTHLPRGSRRLPAECVVLLEAADLILHAGDFVTADVLRELEGYAPVEAVCGNNDEPELVQLLPERRVVEIAGRRMGMVHDAGPRRGREARLARMFPGCDAVVYAHSHIAEAFREGAMWILNPGSPTERRRSPSRSMIWLEASLRTFRPQVVTFST